MKFTFIPASLSDICSGDLTVMASLETAIFFVLRDLIAAEPIIMLFGSPEG